PPTALETAQPPNNVPVISMGRETVDHMNRCANRIVHAEDPNLPCAFGNQPAPRAKRLESDEHDRIPLVRQALHQVMKNAPARCHSISRDNNGGKTMLIDRLDRKSVA